MDEGGGGRGGGARVKQLHNIAGKKDVRTCNTATQTLACAIDVAFFCPRLRRDAFMTDSTIHQRGLRSAVVRLKLETDRRHSEDCHLPAATRQDVKIASRSEQNQTLFC